MGSKFLANILENDVYRFHFVTAPMKPIDDNIDRILMLDMDTKELYEGFIQHITRFLKMYWRLEGQ